MSLDSLIDQTAIPPELAGRSTRELAETALVLAADHAPRVATLETATLVHTAQIADIADRAGKAAGKEAARGAGRRSFVATVAGGSTVAAAFRPEALGRALVDTLGERGAVIGLAVAFLLSVAIATAVYLRDLTLRTRAATRDRRSPHEPL